MYVCSRSLTVDAWAKLINCQAAKQNDVSNGMSTAMDVCSQGNYTLDLAVFPCTTCRYSTGQQLFNIQPQNLYNRHITKRYKAGPHMQLRQQRIRKGVSFSGLCLPEITQLPCYTASQLRKSNCIHSLTLFRFISRHCSLPENTEESAHTASWHRGVIVAGVWSDWCLGWRNANWSGSCISPQNFGRLM